MAKWPKENSRVDVLYMKCVNEALSIKGDGFGENYRRHPETIGGARRFWIHLQWQRFAETVTVILKNSPFARNQLVDAFHLTAPDRRLNVRHLVLESDALGPELSLLAPGATVVAERKYSLVEVVVIRDEHSSFSGGHRLGAVERKCSECAH